MSAGTRSRSPSWRSTLVAGLVEVATAQLVLAAVLDPSIAGRASIHAAVAIAQALIAGLTLLLRLLRIDPQRPLRALLPPLALIAVSPLLLRPSLPWALGLLPALTTVWGVRLLIDALDDALADEPSPTPLGRRLGLLFATVTVAAILLVGGAALARGGGVMPTPTQVIVSMIAAPLTVVLGALIGGLMGSILGRDVDGTAAALASSCEHPQRAIRVTRDDRLGAIQEALEGLRLRLLDELARREEVVAHAREAAAARAEFLAGLSQDAFTAAAVIGDELASLAASATTPEARAAVAAREVAHRDFERLIRELVDLALLESAGLRLTIVGVDLRAVVDNALATHQEAARRRELHLRRSGASELPRVPADAARLQQILDTIVAQAIELAEPSVVQVEVRVIDESATVTVTVRDRIGAGVRLAEALSERGDGRHAPRGARDLAIARGLARAHGGELEARAAAESTSLLLSLPLVPPEEPSDLMSSQSSRPRTDDRPRRRLTPAGRAA
ncbi:MAG: hypothetical protein R3B09_16035 [Nannocystaceae bacterium]